MCERLVTLGPFTNRPDSLPPVRRAADDGIGREMRLSPFQHLKGAVDMGKLILERVVAIHMVSAMLRG